MRSTITRTCLALLAAMLLTLGAAAPAQATFHITQIREVHEGGAGAADYVVLQMYAPGQNLVGTHHLRFYDGGGNLFLDYTVPSNVPNSANQSTILFASQGTIGVTPDFVIPTTNAFPGPSGSVCWENVDCVAIGATAPPTGAPSPVGTPVAMTTGITAGQSVVRSITRGCSTLLDAADDTNNSAADFAIGSPNPRNNLAPITETPCTGGSGAGGPNTKIKKRPKNKSDDTSPTFKFKSTESGSTFKCKLDHKKFHKCKSPKTFHGLDAGKHKFKVEAIDAAGNVDGTPAKDKFKVLPG